MKSDRIKGYLFAVVATIAFSNIYIFSKAALNEVHLAQFGVYWFFIALVLNMGWLIKTGNHKEVSRLTKKQLKVLGTLGVLEILTTTSFFLSIHIIPNPAVTSFLGNLYPIILTLMGIVFLKEKFTWLESCGGVLALIGAFIISYQGGEAISELFIPGAGVVLINAFFASTASLIVKMNVKTMSPELINTNRSLWLFVFSLIMLFVYRQPLVIPWSAFANIAIGSTFGPFIAVLTIYYSFRYIEVSKSSIVQSLKGVFVLGGSILYFGSLPLEHQLWGGLLTVVGVFIISVAKTRLFGKERKSRMNISGSQADN